MLWRIVELINSFLFRKLFSNTFEKEINKVLSEHSSGTYSYRRLLYEDLITLNKLLERLEPEQVGYFEAHSYDIKSIEKVFRNPSLIMMGAFISDDLIGYFFLRCFVNKKCFVGRIVDKDHRGKGIGKAMNAIMYRSAWDSGFRCFATISKHNELVMKAHAHNPHLRVIKELANDHLLVEFVEHKN